MTRTCWLKFPAIAFALVISTPAWAVANAEGVDREPDGGSASMLRAGSGSAMSSSATDRVDVPGPSSSEEPGRHGVTTGRAGEGTSHTVFLLDNPSPVDPSVIDYSRRPWSGTNGIARERAVSEAGGDGGAEVPTPGWLALIGIGLLGGALVPRLRKS